VVTTEAGKVFSSKIKGESLRDTIINLGGYQPAAIMARFEDTGSAQQAAEVLDCPLINGGDGKGEHPTQTVVDLYTIRNHFGSIDGLTVALGGDLLNGRTVNSLAKKLCDYDVKLVLVSPDELRMDRAVISLLRERGVTVEETNEMNDGLSAANVVYWTRLQAERFGDDRTLKRQMIAEQEKFSIGLEQMTLMQKDAILLHPLPRVTPGFIDKEGDMLYPEILPEVDPDPRALYFKQSENGQPVRIALLRWALEPMYSVHGQFPPR
jgi:aspartate carbamoyltransferase catalytic subunit